MRSIVRRLLAAAAAVLATACLAGAATAQTVPLTITNSSGYTGKVYVTVYGSTNPAANDTWFYVSSAAGKATKLTASGKAKNYGFEFTGKSFKLNVPMLQSARVYVSYGKPLLLTVGSDGRPSTPSGWTPGNADFNTAFDFAEYTWVANTGPGGGTQMYMDTTQVDAFGIPIRMTLKGKPGGKATTLVGGFKDAGAGAKIVSALQKAGNPWKKLIVSTKSGPIRIISPVHAMMLPAKSANAFPTTYWNGYINQVFAKYGKPKTTFVIVSGGITYTGAIKNGKIVLTPKIGAATVFSKPTSQDLWANGPPLVSGGNGPDLQRYMQAAFLRSTFLADRTLSDCKGTKPYKLAPVNLYSKVIHQYAFQEEAYTFPYDDVCSQSSTISLLQPTSMELTLYPLAGKGK